MSKSPPIIYTWTDEAPALATHAFLPVIRAFAGAAGVPVETRDISLAGRMLAAFADAADPTIGASPTTSLNSATWSRRPRPTSSSCPTSARRFPQLTACIEELRAKGYALPDYPEEPANAEERATQARYDKVKGSAVNPVLRQGNSDRRAPKAVKDFAHAESASRPGLAEGFAHARGDHGRGRFPAQRDLRHPAERHDRDDRACGGRWSRDRFEGVVAPARRRGARRDLHESTGSPGLPEGTDRRRQGARRAVFDPPEGDHDEGLRPHHVRTLCAGLLRRRVHEARRGAR